MSSPSAPCPFCLSIERPHSHDVAAGIDPPAAESLVLIDWRTVPLPMECYAEFFGATP